MESVPEEVMDRFLKEEHVMCHKQGLQPMTSVMGIKTEKKSEMRDASNHKAVLVHKEERHARADAKDQEKICMKIQTCIDSLKNM